MTTKITTILWDLDGTLINSEPLQDQALIYATNQMGKSINSSNLPLGGGFDNLTLFKLFFCNNDEIFNPENFNKWENLMIDYLGQNFAKIIPITQSIELLHKFVELGFTQAIVSNSPSRFIVECADSLGISKNISHVVGRDKVKYGKPEPDLYLEAMWLNHVKPENCLVFEDSFNGIMAATNAKLKNIIGIGEHDRIKHLLAHSCSLSQASWLDDVMSTFF